MRKDVADHLYSAIDRAEIATRPFHYFYVRDVLPADFYRDLIAGLPDNSAYEKFPAPYEARLGLQLSEKALGHFPGKDVWAEFEAWIHSQEFLDKVVGKFIPYLSENESYRGRQLKKAAVGADGIRIEPRSLLVRDYTNFAISPHTDSASKTVVGAFYLPKDDSQKSFGTSFYSPRNKTFTDWDSERFEYDEFDLAYTAEYVPNSMLVFMKSARSFHGVEQRQESAAGRDVLFWTPTISAKQLSEASLVLPRNWFVREQGILAGVKRLFSR